MKRACSLNTKKDENLTCGFHPTIFNQNHLRMKKITLIISFFCLTALFISCAESQKVDSSEAPEEVKNAIESSYQLSKELTELQIKAGEDRTINPEEISAIGEVFRKLAIINNYNLKTYKGDKYFIALSRERKKEFDELASKVTFLKDCAGYNELGLAIQKIALEVKDVTELPVVEPASDENSLEAGEAEEQSQE